MSLCDPEWVLNLRKPRWAHLPTGDNRSTLLSCIKQANINKALCTHSEYNKWQLKDSIY